MKNFVPVLLFMVVSILAGCCVHAKLRHPEPRVVTIDDLKSNTVALVIRDEDGDITPFCSGVWIDNNKILTADHCARVMAEAFITKNAIGNETEEELEDLVQKSEDGSKISYITDKEYTGMWREPKAIHVLRVIGHDKNHDVALLTIDDDSDVPIHHSVTLATKIPNIGEKIQIMGHPLGLAWTYTMGYVGAYREENFRLTKKTGPFMQVIGPIWRGNSGGGGYNETGELVGIASFLLPGPNESIFVHLETIRDFLNQHISR